MSKEPKCTIFNLANGAELKYYKEFLSSKVSCDIYSSLINDVPWEHGTYKMFGKDVKTPRVLYAMKNNNTDITNVYDVTNSMAWSNEIKILKKKINHSDMLNLIIIEMEMIILVITQIAKFNPMIL